jgi:cytidylate kinase
MGIVAISQTYGSLGDQIAQQLARALDYRFADREIILRAAAEFGEGLRELEHVTEGRPTFWERLSGTRQRYLASIEAVLFELATGDDVVLAGRGAPFSLQPVPHALRVRISAPRRLRAQRLGLGLEEGLDAIRQSDGERAARVQFLYQVDWNEVPLYDLVLNTERLDVPAAVRLIREALAAERFRATPESRAVVRDLGLAARARATLFQNPRSRELDVTVACQDGVVILSGRVAYEEDRALAGSVTEGIAGVRQVQNQIAVVTTRSRV